MLLSIVIAIVFCSSPSWSTDLLKTFRTSACDQELLDVKCPQHTKIIVDKVFYGKSSSSFMEKRCEISGQYSLRVSRKGHGRRGQRRRILNDAAPVTQFDDVDCEVTNARMLILEKCQNKDECHLRVNPRLFGRDPCPSTRKYVQLSYKCRPSEFMSNTYCDGSQVDLQCLPGQALTVVSATYGRSIGGGGQPECGEKISNRVLDGCQINVLQNIKNKCQGRSNCFFNVTNRALKIPKHPGICSSDVKRPLTLVHMCVDEKVFDENLIHDMEVEAEDGELEESQFVATTVVVQPDKKSMNDARYENVHERTTVGIAAEHLATGGSLSVETFDAANNISECHNTSSKNFHCENGTSGILVVHFHQWMFLKRFLLSNKSEVLKYFLISAVSGAILIIILCLINQLVIKYCTKQKRCSMNISPTSSPSNNSSMTTNNDHHFLKIDNHVMVNNYSISRRTSSLTATKQYYLTDDKASIPTAASKNNQKKRRSSTTEFRNVQGISNGFYQPAPDRSSIDYMAIGSPLGADSLLEDEYYV